MAMFGILKDTPGFNPIVEGPVWPDPTPEEYQMLLDHVDGKNINYEGKSKFTLVRIEPVIK